MQEVRRHFRPGLLNRLDEIVVFDPLSHDELKKVARLQMKDVANRLVERGVALGVTDDALDLVLQKGYDPRRWELNRGFRALRWGFILLVLGSADPAFFHQPNNAGDFSGSRRDRNREIWGKFCSIAVLFAWRTVQDREIFLLFEAEVGDFYTAGQGFLSF